MTASGNPWDNEACVLARGTKQTYIISEMPHSTVKYDYGLQRGSAPSVTDIVAIPRWTVYLSTACRRAPLSLAGGRNTTFTAQWIHKDESVQTLAYKGLLIYSIQEQASAWRVSQTIFKHIVRWKWKWVLYAGSIMSSCNMSQCIIVWNT